MFTGSQDDHARAEDPRGALLDRMDSLTQIATTVLAQHDEPATLARIVDLAVLAIDGCDVATVSSRCGDDPPTTPAATHESGVRADLHQYELGEGPCLETIDAGRSYLSNDLTIEPRWPAWAPRAVEIGFRSVISVRLVTPRSGTAALNLYSWHCDSFDSEDVGIAHLYGSQASVAMSAANKIDNLQAALASRHVIGIAQGILMTNYGLDVDRAFEVLRRYSQENNRKLRDVAHDIVEGRRLPVRAPGRVSQQPDA